MHHVTSFDHGDEFLKRVKDNGFAAQCLGFERTTCPYKPGPWRTTAAWLAGYDEAALLLPEGTAEAKVLAGDPAFVTVADLEAAKAADADSTRAADLAARLVAYCKAHSLELGGVIARLESGEKLSPAMCEEVAAYCYDRVLLLLDANANVCLLDEVANFYPQPGEEAGQVDARFTVFCVERNGTGTTWVGAVTARDVGAAADAGVAECALDWGMSPLDIHVMGVAAGDVNILEWNDLED